MSTTHITPGTDIDKPAPISPRKLFSLSLLVAGCFQIALGIGSIAAPAAGAYTVEIIVGVVLLMAGFSELTFAWAFREVPGAVWRFLRSACFLATGYILLGVPLTGVVTLALLLGFGFIFDGALRLKLASQLESNRTWVFLDGALGILLGFIIVMGWPADSVFILGTIVGIRLLMTGCMLLLAGAALRRTHFEG
jgi:uncharacterized membrane protein HdeD (DUF308 family)